MEDPYVNEYGLSLFERVFTAYDMWLDGIPYVQSADSGVEAYAQRQLLRDVWPATEQLCIRLEAKGKGELSSRIERGFRDVEDYARIIDDYCRSDRFDFDLWRYGDPSLNNMQYEKDGDPAVLSAKAEKIAGQPVGNLDNWFYRREWIRDLAEECEGAEIEKYGNAPTDDYVAYVARWAWACFWLAAQLRHHRLDHHKAYSQLERLLSSLCMVSETKYPLMEAVLGRAYGMRIYPIEPMESEEVLRAIEGFGVVVTETQAALYPPEGIDMGPKPASETACETRVALCRGEDAAGASQTPTSDTAKTAHETPVTLVQFIKQYCLDGENISPSRMTSHKNSVLNAAQYGNIELPDHVGKWKTGKAKYYRPSDLIQRWQTYTDIVPNLPPLKS